MSVSEVEGFGRQRGHANGYISSGKVKFLPKTKLEIVVEEEIVDEIIKLIVRPTQTGMIGSGKIFVIPVEDAVRIRTSESGRSAVS